MRAGGRVRVRRGVLPAVVVLCAALGTVTGTGNVSPAGAQAAPALTVTPSSGVHDGERVEVRITGLPVQLFAIYQCDATVLDDLSDRTPCSLMWIETAGGADPYVQELAVQEFFTYSSPTGPQQVHCGDEPDDCAIVAWEPAGNRAVGTAFDMDVNPLAVTPRDSETGFPVTAAVSLPPGSSAQLAQCADPAGPTLAESRCTAPMPVPLDPVGRADVPVTLVDEIDIPGGPVDCLAVVCAVSLFDGAGSLLGSVTVVVHASDGPPTLTGDVTTRLRDGLAIRVVVGGIRNEGLVLAQCDASVTTAAEVADGPCGPPLFTHEADRSTIGVEPDVTVHRTVAAVDGSTVQCDRAPTACVLALASDLGNFVALPLSFEVPDEVALSPASGLLDGQDITVTSSQLDPDGEYVLMRCAGVTVNPGNFWTNAEELRCDRPNWEAPIVTAAPDGTLTTTFPAAQRFTGNDGRDVYCRDQCQVVLARWFGHPAEYSVVDYAMATGSIAASPSTGLADRQAVTVTGTDLMSTYAGPLFLFLRAGSWGLGQCGREVLDNLHLFGVLQHCSVPTGGGEVQVPGSTFTRTVRPRAEFTAALGDPVDCRAEAEACVLLLARIEQDGTMSFHSSALSFGP